MLPQVVTAQYFVWFMSLLPLALPHLDVGNNKVQCPLHIANYAMPTAHAWDWEILCVHCVV